MDPVLLFAEEDAITEGVKDCIAKAGSQVGRTRIISVCGGLISAFD